MLKFLTTLSAALLTCISAWSAPPNECEQILTLPDGRQVRVRIQISIGGQPVDITQDRGAYVPPKPVSYDYSRPSIQNYFRELAESGRLISQSDYRLAGMNLLVQGGGLCSSTCGVNVMHAALRFSGGDTHYFKTSSHRAIKMIVDRVWRDYGIDARMGLGFDMLSTAMRALAGELGVRLGVEYRSLNFDHYFSADNLMVAPDTLVIGAVRTSGNRSHAIVILGADPHTGHVTYADPNTPHLIYTGTYHSVRDTNGRRTVQIGLPGSYQGDWYVGNLHELVYVRAP